MKLYNLSNGGTAEVDAEFAKKLVDGGGWAEVEKPAPKRSRTKKTDDSKE